MSAHLQGFDQRLFGENADAFLSQYVWNVGQFSCNDVAWSCVTQGQSMLQINN